jgi:hypothetical protein
MTADTPDDPRFLDGDALRVARVKALERAFGITLTADEAARCTSAEETTAVFAARLGAVPGGASLRAGALAAVREALREVARADREAIDEVTPLGPLFPRWRRARRWSALGRELHCKLPPLCVTWATAVVAAPVVAVHAAFIRTYPSHRFVDEPTIAFLIGLAVVGLFGVAAVAALFALPERMTTVEKLVTWLVAQRPAASRAGTDWTCGQVAEVVDAVHRLRFFRPGCRRAVLRDVLIALLVLTLVGTSLWLCVLGLASKVVVGPLPPGLR